MSFNLSQIATFIGLLGLVFASLGYGYSQFRKGRADQKKDEVDGELNTLGLLSKRIGELEKLCNSQDKQITELGLKVEALTKAVSERDHKIDEYMLLLSNRDPRFEDFIKLVTKVATESEIFMRDEAKKTDSILANTTKLVGAMQHSVQ